MRDAYRTVAAIPDLVAQCNQVPRLTTRDDHDYGKNDACVEHVHKRVAQQMFLEDWAIPTADPRYGREGIYSAQTCSPAGLRPYTHDDDPNKTLLGEAQWSWLHDQLLQPADICG